MTTTNARKGPQKFNQLKTATIAALLKSVPNRLAKGESVKKMYADGGNLWLSIAASGGASWIFRYTLNGKTRDMGLGRERDVSLATARELATDARRELIDGKDPMAEKLAAKVEVIKNTPAPVAKEVGKTFFDVLDAYLTAKKSEHSDPHWDQNWRNMAETYARPFFGETPIDQITYDMALAVLKQRVTVDGEKTTFWHGMTPTAQKMRQRIIKVMQIADSVPGYKGENPDRWDRRFNNDLATAARIMVKEQHPALPYALLPDFVAELRKRGTVVAYYLEFLILTANGARSGPTLCATWDQIDMEKKTWTAPREGLKGRKNEILENFVIPLQDRCIEILEILKKDRRDSDNFIFQGRTKKSCLARKTPLDLIDAMMAEDEKKGIAPRWIDPKINNRRIVQHGFRATFMTYCQDKKLADTELRNFALGHKVKGGVEEGYNRGDMLDLRRALMDAWAAHVATHPQKRTHAPSVVQ